MKLLPDIKRGPTWTPEHKHRCLIRSLARRPNDARVAFFEAYQRRHGRAKAAALHAEVKAERDRIKGGADDGS